jgi:hypothetical protein
MHLSPIIEASSENEAEAAAGSLQTSPIIMHASVISIGKFLSAIATESSGDSDSDTDNGTYTSLSDTESLDYMELGSGHDAVGDDSPQPQSQLPPCTHPMVIVCILSTTAVILWICHGKLL